MRHLLYPCATTAAHVNNSLNVDSDHEFQNVVEFLPVELSRAVLVDQVEQKPDLKS